MKLRPADEIRRHILLQRLYERIGQLGKQSSNSLKQNNIQLLHLETRDFDVWVEYRHNRLIHQAIYPIAMLDAEMEGWLQETSFVPEERHE